MYFNVYFTWYILKLIIILRGKYYYSYSDIGEEIKI